MAPPVASGGQSQVCDICSGILWFNMYPEDVGAIPHHKSRKALEASAEQCILCRMILRAAISNYQTVDPSYNHWLEYLTLTVQDETEVKDVLCTRELGAHRPEHNSTARSPMVMLTPVGRDFIEGLGQESSKSVPVLTPTRDFESKTESEKAIGFPNLENLGIHDPTENLPVWVYGNFWEGSVPKTTGRPIQTVLMGIGARFGTSHKSTGAFKCRQGEMSLRGSAIRICTTDDSPMFSHIPGRLRELQSNSDLAYRRLATWLKNCMDTHPNCNVSRFDPKLPTRVIDVSKTDRTVALIETQGGTGKYIALSHTWGKSPRLTATKKTVDDLKGGVAVSFLPKTFQDAIEITRRLGIKYLWVDCLCIIQDDPQDWEREAAAMTNVYRNSYITISASASSDSHSGCFPSRLKDSYVSPSTRSLGYESPREATGPNSYTSQYEHHSRPGVLNRIHLFEEWLPGSLSVEPQKSLVGSFGKTVDPIADQPLSSRGWTLQERLLAPRVVHYAEDQIYFECETEMASECGFKFPSTNFSLNHCISTQRIAFDQHGIQKEGGVSFIVGQPATGRGSLRSTGGWLSLVEDYSKRSLSVAQDKLSAIAGVARVLAEETGDYYIAGVWASHLMEDIFWRVYTHEEEMEDEGDNWRSRPVLGRRIGNATRPSEYRAPSWSWASVEAPIKFIPLTYSKLVARPIHCYTTPSGADNYGRVQDGFIDIEGPIYEVKTYQPKGGPERHGVPASIDLDDGRGECIGSIHLDIPDETLEFPCYAIFIDPANALIIKSKHSESYVDPHSGRTKQRPKSILSTTGLARSMRKPPRGSTILWVGGDPNHPDPSLRQSKPVQVTQETLEQVMANFKQQVSLVNESNHVMRIGVGSFFKEHNPEGKPADKYDPKIHGELTPDKLKYVGGDDSWGVVTRDDAVIPVQIR